MSSAAGPAVRVRGIVVPTSKALLSFNLGTDDPPEFVFALRPWRIGDGETCDRRLRVTVTTRESMEFWSRQLEDGAVVELDAELEDDLRTARMLSRPAAAEDDGLRRAHAEFLAANQLSDPRFGSFRLYGDVDMFEVHTEWRGHPVTLTLTGDAKAALARAHALFDEAERWEARAREVIRDELLDTFNENWRDEDRPAYAAGQFLAPMTISAVALDGGTFFELEFSDGGLFLGHMVVAKFDEEKGETWAELQG